MFIATLDFDIDDVSRLYRDAKLMAIGDGASEIRRMLIGDELMAAIR